MSRSKKCGDREPADLVAAVGSNISPKVVCDLCQKECVNVAGLQIHQRRVHAEQYMEECAKQAAEKVLVSLLLWFLAIFIFFSKFLVKLFGHQMSDHISFLLFGWQNVTRALLFF